MERTHYKIDIANQGLVLDLLVEGDLMTSQIQESFNQFAIQFPALMNRNALRSEVEFQFRKFLKEKYHDCNFYEIFSDTIYI